MLNNLAYRLGEVPKYLKEFKEKTAEKERLKSLININCPVGHVELTDAERIETLDIAKKSMLSQRMIISIGNSIDNAFSLFRTSESH